VINLTDLNDFLDKQEKVEDERFKVDDDQKANWVLRKIKQMQDKIERNNNLADAEIHKIEQWRERENEQANNSIKYFQGLLAEYAVSKREKDPHLKTINLPNGRFGFRKRQPKWKYNDEKVINALKQAGRTDLIRIKEEPNKKKIKKTFDVIDGKAIDKETGEVVEGITIEEQPESFNVRVD